MAEPIRTEATVVAARPARRGGQAGDGESYWWQDLGSAAFGKTAWDLVLDVQPPGGSPYRVEIRTKQPNRLFGVRGFLDGEVGIAPGLVLPVRVDVSDPSRVDVDWKAFGGQLGAREQLHAASDAKGAAQATATFAATIREDPAAFERRRRTILDSAQDIVDEVRAGRMPPSTLEQFLATNVPPGIITPDEAEAFWRAATDPPS